MATFWLDYLLLFVHTQFSDSGDAGATLISRLVLLRQWEDWVVLWMAAQTHKLAARVVQLCRRTPWPAEPNTHFDHSAGLISSLVLLLLLPIISCCESLILVIYLSVPSDFFHFHLKEWASLGSEKRCWLLGWFGTLLKHSIGKHVLSEAGSAHTHGHKYKRRSNLDAYLEAAIFSATTNTWIDVYLLSSFWGRHQQS